MQKVLITLNFVIVSVLGSVGYSLITKYENNLSNNTKLITSLQNEIISLNQTLALQATKSSKILLTKKMALISHTPNVESYLPYVIAALFFIGVGYFCLPPLVTAIASSLGTAHGTVKGYTELAQDTIYDTCASASTATIEAITNSHAKTTLHLTHLKAVEVDIAYFDKTKVLESIQFREIGSSEGYISFNITDWLHNFITTQRSAVNSAVTLYDKKEISQGQTDLLFDLCEGCDTIATVFTT